MSNPSLRVFLSATTRDLKSYRTEAARVLRRAGCEMKVEEDFGPMGAPILSEMRDYIRDCVGVVCLVGDHFGSAPPPALCPASTQRKEFAHPLASYSNWEFFFAREFDKPTYLFLTGPGFVPDQPPAGTDDEREAQRLFRLHLKGTGLLRTSLVSRSVFAEEIVLIAIPLVRATLGHELPRVLPKKAQHFTGRGDDIAWVKNQLLREKRVALLGPGGIGKTAIAYEAIAALAPEEAPFAHFPGGFFLHDFYAAPGHLAAIENIVAQAGLTDLDDREREPRARALLAGAPALVYLEGCEKAEDLPRFLDLCGPATVLLTSRLDRDGKGATFLRIEALPFDEAATLLRRHAQGAARDPGALPGEADAVWENIAGLLGRHALALRLAGHRLGTDSETPAQFHGLLQKEGFEHFDDDTRRKESLELLFRHSAEALSPEARGAWYALALHALAPLPLPPIAATLGFDDTAARKAVGELVRHTLADAVRMPSETIGETEPAWLLAHTLLPEWGKKRLREFGVEKEESFVRWEAFWFSFLDRCFHARGVPGGPTRYAALTEHLDALLGGIEKHSGGESQRLSAALTKVGSLHLSMGRYAVAEPRYRRDLAISEKTLGPEHADTLASLNNLAVLVSDRGDLAGAEPLFRRALEARERTLGREHVDTLTSLNNLANLVSDRGDLDGAERLYRRALEARERKLGSEDPDTIQSLNNFAILLTKRGDLDGAEPLFRRALEATERSLGREHVETLTSLNNLANVLCLRRDLIGAEPLFRRALEAWKRTRGPEHPDTLGSAFNLAIVLAERGELAEAKLLARRAAEGCRKLLLPQHGLRQRAEKLLARLQAARDDAETAGG